MRRWCARQVADPIARAHGVRRLSRSPLSALLHLALTGLGWWLHEQRSGGPMLVVHALCSPVIATLEAANAFLNRFSMSTVQFFQ
jgi:hypothetical protein